MMIDENNLHSRIETLLTTNSDTAQLSLIADEASVESLVNLIAKTTSQKHSFIALNILIAKINQTTSQSIIPFLFLLINNPDYFQSQFQKNKLALLIVSCFRKFFPKDWPSFFDDIHALVNVQRNDLQLQFYYSDLVVRIAKTLHEEVVCLLINREKRELDQNSFVKDQMRMNGVDKLASSLFQILSLHINDLTIVSQVIQVIGLYVSWIDIKLIVTPDFIQLLYQFISPTPSKKQQEKENFNLKISSLDCFRLIFSKGMKPTEKLDLINILNCIGILEKCLSELTSFTKTEEIEELGECLANFCNALGLELTKCWEEGESNPQIRETSFTNLHQLFPLFLLLFSNEIDDISIILFPFLTAYTAILKKIAKTETLKLGLTPEQQEVQRHMNLGGKNREVKVKGRLPEVLRDGFLRIVKAVVLKMKYDLDDDFWGGEDDDEDEVFFQDMRKNLKGSLEQLYNVDNEVFTSFLPGAVCSTFETIQAGLASGKRMEDICTWVDAELALFLTYLSGESNKGLPVFTIDGSEEPSPIGKMLFAMLTSNVSAYQHPSISPQFFDIVIRYAGFFEKNQSFIPHVLECFCDSRGMHSPKLSVRNRNYYLFLRFVKSFKAGQMGPFLDTVLMSIQDLLVLSLPPQQVVQASQPPLDDKTPIGSAFDSQLYIFEAVGVLISCDAVTDLKKSEYLAIVLNPIILAIKEIMTKELYKLDTPPENTTFTTHLNHLITSIGAISKGFPDFSASQEANRGWVSVFKDSLQVVLAVLDALSQHFCIRDAARFTYQRMVGCMGTEILPFIHPLIKSGVLGASSIVEVVDFLPFLSLIVFKFKPSVLPILDEFFSPLIERIFLFLNQEVTGTDDIVASNDLKKAYLSFLLSIFNSDMESIFTSETNNRHLHTILQSIIHCASDSSDLASQKVGFSILVKMICAWGGGIDPNNNLKPPTISSTKTKSKISITTTTDKSNLTLYQQQQQPTKTKNKTPNSSPVLDHIPTPNPLLPKKPIIEGFQSFIFQTIIPLLFTVPRQFGLKKGVGGKKVVGMSAGIGMVFNEIGLVHRSLWWGLGEVYVEGLRGWVDEGGETKLRGVVGGGGREVRDFLIDYFSG